MITRRQTNSRESFLRVSFYLVLPMVLMRSILQVSFPRCGFYKQYNLSRYEDNFFVFFAKHYSFSMYISLVLLTEPITQRHARHVGSISRALMNWVAINASGFISYYYIIPHFPKGILQFDYFYKYSEDELKVVICSSMFILMSSRCLCPGLDLNIPNALASIGVYMSLVLDIAREDYYYGYRIRYPTYACVLVYSLILSLLKYYVPYKAGMLPTFAAGVAILGFAIDSCFATTHSSPVHAGATVLAIFFGVLFNDR